MKFQNVVGFPIDQTDAILREELAICGVDVEVSPVLISHPEVHTHISGKLFDFTLIRNWYYWVVEGKVPLDVARKLYDDPAGKRDVRVTGHCGCPPPDNWVSYEKDGKKVIATDKKPADWEESYWDNIRDKAVFCDDPANDPEVEKFIGCYHIDSEVGLKLFADTIKKHMEESK